VEGGGGGVKERNRKGEREIRREREIYEKTEKERARERRSEGVSQADRNIK
jgi:hypothetical protein